MPEPDTKPTRTRIITLTNTAPVRIPEAQWPIIAQSSWVEYVAEGERDGWLKVRRHADGRVLVYGGFDSDEADKSSLRGGEVLTPSDSVPAAIRRVGRDVDAAEACIRDCIARLPVVEL